MLLLLLLSLLVVVVAVVLISVAVAVAVVVVLLLLLVVVVGLLRFASYYLTKFCLMLTAVCFFLMTWSSSQILQVSAGVQSDA